MQHDTKLGAVHTAPLQTILVTEIELPVLGLELVTALSGEIGFLGATSDEKENLLKAASSSLKHQAPPRSI